MVVFFIVMFVFWGSLVLEIDPLSPNSILEDQSETKKVALHA